MGRHERHDTFCNRITLDQGLGKHKLAWILACMWLHMYMTYTYCIVYTIYSCIYIWYAGHKQLGKTNRRGHSHWDFVQQANVEDTKSTLQTQSLQNELLGHASQLDRLVLAKSMQSYSCVLKQCLLDTQTPRGYCCILIGGISTSNTGFPLLLSFSYCTCGYAKMEGTCPAAEYNVFQVPYAYSKP